MTSWHAIGTARRAAVGASILAGLVLALPAAGQSVSVLSTAEGARLDGRPLACNAELRPGARLATPATNGVSLAAGDVYVRMDRRSRLEVRDRGALHLDAGALRLVDGREGSPEALVLRTPHAEIRGTGLDAEVLVENGWSRACAVRGEVELANRTSGDATRLRGGECARTGASGTTQRLRARARLPLPDARGCIDVAVASQFTPADVAAPPPSLDLFPLDPDKRTFGPCDDPGSGCGAPPMPAEAPEPTLPDFGFGAPESPQPGETDMGSPEPPTPSGVRSRFEFGSLGPESP